MSDLTVIFITANEHPEHFTRFHADVLRGSLQGHELITISRTSTKFNLIPGRAHIFDEEPQSHFNMYRQLLKAAKLAETPYVATAESDTLYPPEHFTFYRPPADAVAYDMSRWVLYTWNPIFSLKQRISNSTLIAPRDYLIDALEERYGENSKVPPHRVGEVGRHIHERALGVTLRNAKQVWCDVPTIQINHPNGTNFREMNNGHRKKLGEIKALDIPYWGKAQDLVNEYR